MNTNEKLSEETQEQSCKSGVMVSGYRVLSNHEITEYSKENLEYLDNIRRR
jgi:hypothetical protein